MAQSLRQELSNPRLDFPTLSCELSTQALPPACSAV